MLLEVKSRSPESWGPLASVSESMFNHIINGRPGSAKDKIKKLKAAAKDK
jgi:hypothetical protein